MGQIKKLSAFTCSILYFGAPARANEDIEFVAEHLIEVAMDNRYASLPIWDAALARANDWSPVVSGGYESMHSGNLKVSGPMLALALTHPIASDWNVGAFIFADALKLSGTNDYRPLQTLFAPATPISRPVDARFDNLDGRMDHFGIGIQISKSVEDGWMGRHRWVGGVLWERMALRDVRLDYAVIAGPSAGAHGQIDFDTTYTHYTPFVGMELPRSWDRWAVAPHVLLAWPLPGRPLVGHITGPGFDIRGQTGDVGDPSATIGLDITYLPAQITVDVGTLLTQRYLEPFIHEGVQANWVLTLQWRY